MTLMGHHPLQGNACDCILVVFPMAGWCREERITEGAKRRQMAKMLTLILTPIIVLLCVSFYFVSDNIVAKMDADKVGFVLILSHSVKKNY